MDTTAFGDVIAAARASAGPGKRFHQTLTGHLATRTLREILQYQDGFDELHLALYRWDLWAAAFPIAGGCSDDSFIDFRAGLIAQGRDWYHKAAASPDGLAGHPALAVTRPAWDNPLFYEPVNYAACYAYQRVSGDERAFYDALASRGQRTRGHADMGEDLDFGDDQQMRTRLPRLFALSRGYTPTGTELAARHRQRTLLPAWSKLTASHQPAGRFTLGDRLRSDPNASIHRLWLQFHRQHECLTRVPNGRSCGLQGPLGTLQCRWSGWVSAAV